MEQEDKVHVVRVTEKSYTSKTSALDLAPPSKPSAYAGKRFLHRGLFRSRSGRVINADVNGSIQIIRMYLPEAFTVEGAVSCALQPMLANLAEKTEPQVSISSVYRVYSLPVTSILIANCATLPKI